MKETRSSTSLDSEADAITFLFLQPLIRNIDISFAAHLFGKQQPSKTFE